MLTRCPACTTSFRVTPEQLKTRAGKVRCGKCQSVFNALDSLAETSAETDSVTSPPNHAPDDSREPSASAQPGLSASHDPIDILLKSPTPGGGNDSPEAAPASSKAIRDSAMAAGLVAARETTEIPGYNKWAEGALTSPAALSAPVSRSTWPFVVAALLLAITLAGQVTHRYRAELAVAAPGLRPLLETVCASLECDIPLPRHADLVSIEASDLQVDPTHGGALTLTATLKNRAAYAQAWPQLELTLTDVQDNAVLRRVLQPADYLPPKVDPTLFPPNGEAAIRLWLEVKDITAAGYRLFVFYP